mgnify:CR=1 FL=1
MPARSMRVPLVVLTGFLGAGKTTLVNRVIAARAAAGAAAGKLAIIVNEAGAIGIDADLLPRGSARQVELPGGCVCCVLADELDRTILEILDGNPEVDTILLETTGVAEPVPIVWTLERAPLADRVRVAAIVTVVDPLSWPAARATSAAAEIQLESADVIILAKLDAASADQVAVAQAAAAALAPHAPVLAVPTADAAAWLLATLADPPERAPGPDADSAHHHDHDHGHGPLHGVTSAAVPIAPGVEVDLERFEDAVAALPSGFFRVKAIVFGPDPRLGDQPPGWAVVHRVGGRVSSEPIPAPAGGARIVGLGQDATAAPLAGCVAAAVVGSARSSG